MTLLQFLSSPWKLPCNITRRPLTVCSNGSHFLQQLVAPLVRHIYLQGNVSFIYAIILILIRTIEVLQCCSYFTINASYRPKMRLVNFRNNWCVQLLPYVSGGELNVPENVLATRLTDKFVYIYILCTPPFLGSNRFATSTSISRCLLVHAKHCLKLEIWESKLKRNSHFAMIYVMLYPSLLVLSQAAIYLLGDSHQENEATLLLAYSDRLISISNWEVYFEITTQKRTLGDTGNEGWLFRINRTHISQRDFEKALGLTNATKRCIQVDS